MTGRDIFKIWAPSGARWVDWVRPVPFVAINNNFKSYTVSNFSVPEINYIKEAKDDIAIIVDLPGYHSVNEGIALGKMGFRPIPIYNGTTEQEGAMPTVDNNTAQNSLIWGASELQKLEIKEDAPPVFLVDSNRMNRLKMNDSVFDNSWDIYDQDIPSAEYFLKNGINKIIVRGEKIQRDFCKILYKFQNKGIKILFTDGYEEPEVVKLKKPHKKKNDD